MPEKLTLDRALNPSWKAVPTNSLFRSWIRITFSSTASLITSR